MGKGKRKLNDSNGSNNSKKAKKESRRSNKSSKNGEKKGLVHLEKVTGEDSHGVVEQQQQQQPEEEYHFDDMNKSLDEHQSNNRTALVTVRPSREEEGATNSRSVTAPSSSSSGYKNNNKKKVAFLKKKIDFVVSLLPGALRNCDDAVERSIDQLLLKHSPGIGGIMMAYENLNFNKQHKEDQGRGWILNELPYIHFDVTCDILVFRPVVGCELRGVVNECFPSHISILVFQYFNAMVSAEELHAAGYTFDRDLHNWVQRDGDGDDDNTTVSTEVKIRFIVSKIHECEGTISLEGAKPSLSMLLENG